MESRRRTEILWPFDCRTCHAKEPVLVTDVANPEAFHIVRRCPHCGYLNVLERSVITLPILKSIGGLPSNIQEGLLKDFEETAPAVMLRRMSEVFVAHLDRFVASKTIAAAAGLMLLLKERERALAAVVEGQIGVANSSADLHAKVVSRATDLLYALLHRNGGARIINDSQAVYDIGLPFVRQFTEIASDAAGVALQAAGVEEGLWSVTGFHEGDLRIEKTEIHARIAEWDLNRREFENRVSGGRLMSIVDDIFTAETLAAQRLALGFDSTDLIRLGQESFEPGSAAGSFHDLFDTLWAVRVDQLDQSRKRLVNALTLTLPTIKGFIAPFYFDLGVARRQPVEEIRAVTHVLLANWTNYYPVYELFDESGNPWRVTSKAPFVICLANLASFRNSLFRRLVDTAGQRQLSPDTLKALRQVERRVERRLEQAVATILQDNGWQCVLRLQKWKGSRLTFGDIDLVAAKQLDEQRAVVLLIEVKDYDMPVMSKKDALKRMQGQLQGAFDQLAVRIQWVKVEWDKGLKDLLLPGGRACSCQLLPVVVTARYMPPFLFDRFLGIPLDGLPIFLERLSGDGMAAYQAVAGETVVTLECSP